MTFSNSSAPKKSLDTALTTFIASQKIDTGIIGRIKFTRSKRKQIGSPEKEVHASNQSSVSINQNTNTSVPNVCLVEDMQKLPVRAEAFPERFIGGFTRVLECRYASCSQ